MVRSAGCSCAVPHLALDLDVLAVLQPLLPQRQAHLPAVELVALGLLEEVVQAELHARARKRVQSRDRAWEQPVTRSGLALHRFAAA